MTELMTTTGVNRDVETIITGDTDGDYVKVVRCKDCKYNYGIANNCDFSKSDIVCTLWESDGFDESDYCSHGERKESE